jgi:hypothetical protein
MPRKRTDLVAKAACIIDAWRKSFPTKRFSGMTLAEFEEMVRPSRAVRAELEEITKTTKILRIRRRTLDQALRPGIQRVVYAVRGDPEAGENSAMYLQMGYVAKRRRRKPGPKKKAKVRGKAVMRREAGNARDPASRARS